MYIYDQASSLQRKSSLYKISELKLKRAIDRGLPLGRGGVFVEKQPVKVIHSEPASWIGKSRRAVADRPLQAILVKCISLYLMSPSSLTERGTLGVHMPFQGGCLHVADEFPSKKEINTFPEHYKVTRL